MNSAAVFLFAIIGSVIFWAAVFTDQGKGKDFKDHDGEERHGGLGYGGRP